MVSISTIRDGKYYDNSCVLKAGEHDFIKRDSFVLYSRARIEPAEKIMKGVECNEFIYKGIMNANSFQSICDGLMKSHHASPKVKKFFSDSVG
ncbi:hypothetical protein MMIC_P1807 [Mariprofundus micogutta]|uniref:Uncharacterized protein n=2 Tax=Mariprofundus micogutta TaxID=1921010 RepID=A0A1L8CPI5_9PROT|nr:hypothetical protein MMIC_P1807 [Mariprofundus micogutta]